jgi:beta-galactosidase
MKKTIINTVLIFSWCGYTSMYIDITPYAVYGDNVNTIAIRVDANAQEGWWYEGAGMYRHTWLVKRSPLHIITDGVYAHPVKKENSKWELPVEVTLNNTANVTANSEVEITLFDAKGNQIAQERKAATTVPLRDVVVNLLLAVNSPKLWSVETPVLYSVKTVVKQNGIITDQVETKCGFRTTRFDANTGFYLNDKNIKLKGVCNHQDHAGVGVAVPDALWEFRLRKLKEMGVNAYRCSHNPPSTEFLNVCDSLGILVMDENRNFNSSPECVNQLEWLVRRDRNRPSIILWSVFNEEPMQGTENGYQMVRRMADKVKQLDTARPVTAAMNGGFTSPVNVS